MIGTATVIPALGGHLDRWVVWARRLHAWTWPILAAALIAVVLTTTWQQWTVIAFPYDAGRELVVPQMLSDGQILYRDIRCFYGPVGYWLNACLMDLLGGDVHALWLSNTLRFVATCGLLWILARHVCCSSAWATLAIAASALPLFHSFLVPYSASVGWGAFFLLAGLVCAAPQLADSRTGQGRIRVRFRVRMPTGWESSESSALVHSITAAACLALAAACKHEYALAAGLVWVSLMVDALWRGQSPLAKAIAAEAGPSGSRARQQATGPLEIHGSVLMAGLMMGMTVPLAVIGKLVLSHVSWHELIANNLWLQELMAYHGQDSGYNLSTALKPSQYLTLIELAALLGAAVCSASIFGICRRTGSRRALAAWASAAYFCILVVGAAELLTQLQGQRAGDIYAVAKPRLRQLIESVPMLVMPAGCFVVLASVAYAFRRGPRALWQHLNAADRLGFICLLACLPFCARGQAGLTELNRHPLLLVVLAWLLLRIVPTWCRWRSPERSFWFTGLAALLLAMAGAGLDDLAYRQSRPHAQLHGPAGSTYVTQRRKPYTPDYFHSVLQMACDHRDRIAGQSLACIPEGAWINALMDRPWPMRDTQWMPFCQQWVLEDLRRKPPAFLLQLEPLKDQAAVEAAIAHNYVPIARNALGVTLFEYRSDLRLTSVHRTGGP